MHTPVLKCLHGNMDHVSRQLPPSCLYEQEHAQHKAKGLHSLPCCLYRAQPQAASKARHPPCAVSPDPWPSLDTSPAHQEQPRAQHEEATAAPAWMP